MHRASEHGAGHMGTRDMDGCHILGDEPRGAQMTLSAKTRAGHVRGLWTVRQRCPQSWGLRPSFDRWGAWPMGPRMTEGLQKRLLSEI